MTTTALGNLLHSLAVALMVFLNSSGMAPTNGLAYHAWVTLSFIIA